MRRLHESDKREDQIYDLHQQHQAGPKVDDPIPVAHMLPDARVQLQLTALGRRARRSQQRARRFTRARLRAGGWDRVGGTRLDRLSSGSDTSLLKCITMNFSRRNTKICTRASVQEARGSPPRRARCSSCGSSGPRVRTSPKMYTANVAKLNVTATCRIRRARPGGADCGYRRRYGACEHPAAARLLDDQL